MVKVKICANKSIEEAKMCIDAGADIIGILVGQEHTSNDFVDKYIAKEIESTDREFLANMWSGNPNGAPHRWIERKEEGDNGDYDMQRNSGTWEENKEFLTSHYPITKGWFQGKEKSMSDEIKQLKQENAQDKEQIARLQKMLETTLEFCNKVRQSAVGKIFFGKDAKKLPSKNELPEGRDER